MSRFMSFLVSKFNASFFDSTKPSETKNSSIIPVNSGVLKRRYQTRALFLTPVEDGQTTEGSDRSSNSDMMERKLIYTFRTSTVLIIAKITQYFTQTHNKNLVLSHKNLLKALSS